MKISTLAPRPMLLLDEMPELAWSSSPDGEILYANRRCYEYTGMDVTQNPESGWEKSIHSDDLPTVFDHWQSAVERKREFQCEYRLKNADGDYRWFLVRATPIQNLDGEITEWLGSATDIHDLKLAQEELKRARVQLEVERAQLRLALATAELGTCVRDWKTGEILLDAQHAKIMGFPAVERTISSEDFAECFHPDNREEILNTIITAAAEKKMVCQTEWRIQFPVTKEVRVIKSMIRFEYDMDGTVVRSFGLVSDITDQKSAQDKLVGARKDADLATRAKSHFLANMSHEIRTPMGVILGYTDLALESKNLDPETRSYLLAARNNGEALKKLIGDLLDLAKIESEKVELEEIEVDIPTLIEDVLSSMQVRAREKNIQLNVDVSRLSTRAVLTDPTSIRQVLTNLINNAIKFTKEGSVTLMACEETAPGGLIRFVFRVRDTGLGISEDMVGRLFKPFSQADGSMRRNYTGTGLGLVISRKLARLLGGDVKLVETLAGVGSVFQFTFLTQAAEAHADEPDTQVIEPMNANLLAGFRILIVEDSVDNRELLTLYLTRAGAEVEVAENGVYGVRKAMAYQPDAVLMDIQMPDMDGYEANRKLKSEHFGKPIIALTAHALKSERDRALDEGFTSYLTKPVDRQKLVSTLSQLIRADRFH